MAGTDSTTVTVLEDTDGDGMPDTWENTYPGLNPSVNDATGDLDNDGLINIGCKSPIVNLRRQRQCKISIRSADQDGLLVIFPEQCPTTLPALALDQAA